VQIWVELPPPSQILYKKFTYWDIPALGKFIQKILIWQFFGLYSHIC